MSFWFVHCRICDWVLSMIDLMRFLSFRFFRTGQSLWRIKSIEKVSKMFSDVILILFSSSICSSWCFPILEIISSVDSWIFLQLVLQYRFDDCTRFTSLTFRFCQFWHLYYTIFLLSSKNAEAIQTESDSSSDISSL